MSTHSFLALALPFLLLAAPGFAQAPSATEHRFGLFIGHNDGGENTRPLLYAHDDTQRLYALFLRLGQMQPQDAMLLNEQSADELTIAWGELERKIRAAKAQGERTRLFIFISAHAKNGALRFGASRLALETLKERLAHGPADLRVAVLDVCGSTGVSVKGAPPSLQFEVETDVTRASLKGLVIFTASATDEAAKESDIVGSGLFSYYFATALMGAADGDGNRHISLEEAIASVSRAQSISSKLDFADNGALELTNLEGAKEGLFFPAAAPSWLYLVVDTRGIVAAEIVKREGEQFLALPQGRYVIKRRLEDRLRLNAVEVNPGQLTAVHEADFRNAKFLDDPVKGTQLRSSFSRHWSIAASGGYQMVLGASPFPSAALLGAEVTLHNVVGRGWALAIDGGYGWAPSAVANPALGNPPYQYTLVTFGGGFLYEWFPHDRWAPFAGVHLSFNSMTRTFSDSLLPRQNYSTLAPGLFVGLKVRLTKTLSAAARVRGHYLHYDIDEARHIGTAEFGAVLDYEF